MYGIPFSYIIVLGLCAQIKRGAPFLISLLLKIIPLKGAPFFDITTFKDYFFKEASFSKP